jgi:hypothetical protein
MKSSQRTRFCILCLCLGTGWISTAMADTLKSLPVAGGYHIEYRVYWHGFYAANAHHRVERLTDDRYVARTHVTPRFPFIPFEYEEKSLFFDTGTAIQPLNFTFKWREKKERLKGMVHFDWKQQRRTASGYSASDAPIALIPLSQDKISLVFQLGRYLENNAPLSSGTKWSYSVIEAKKQKTYVFESIQEEWLNTPLGSLRTLKIQQSAARSARHSYLWFALDKNYLLVKIAQFKDSDLIGYTLIHALRL